MTEKKTETKQSIYERLSKIDVSSYLKPIKNKNFTLNYLSWANAWGLVKAIYPDATYKIKEYPNWQQLPDGTFQQVGTLDYRITAVGCEVEVTVNIEGNEYTQKLYPMDYKNNPIMKPSIKDINKAQMRCLVKALATAGLGLSVYAGDDLPTNEGETAKKPAKVNRSRAERSNTSSMSPKTTADQATEQIRDEIIDWEKPETISTEYLENYGVKYLNGSMIQLKFIVPHAHGKTTTDKKVKDFVDTLKGKDAVAYMELDKRWIKEQAEKAS